MTNTKKRSKNIAQELFEWLLFKDPQPPSPPSSCKSWSVSFPHDTLPLLYDIICQLYMDTVPHFCQSTSSIRKSIKFYTLSCRRRIFMNEFYAPMNIKQIKMGDNTLTLWNERREQKQKKIHGGQKERKKHTIVETNIHQQKQEKNDAKT